MERRTEAAADIALAPATPRGEDEPQTPARVEEEWSVGLAGRVVDEHGAPIEGAELETQDGIVRGRSNPEGSIEALPGASLPWHEHLFGGGCALHVFAEGRDSRTLEVRVQDGVTLQLGTIVLEPGVEVSGLVRDESGQAVRDAYVSLHRGSDWPPDSERAQEHGIESLGLAQTNEEGRYRMRGVPLGEVFLSAEARDRERVWSQVFVLRPGDDAVQDLTLESDGTLQVRWTIRVLDPRGSPVPRAEVSVARRSFFRFQVHQRDQTNEAGTAELLLPAGQEVLVRAEDTEGNWRPAPEELRLPTEDSSFDLVLRELAWWVVVVTDPLGRPIPGSSVRVSGVRGDVASEALATDADGSIRILLPGTGFQVRGSAPGFETETSGPFDPDAVATEEPLLIRLSPGLAVGGRVLALGEPVARASVLLRRESEPRALWFSTELASVETPFELTTLAHGGRAETDATGSFLINVEKDGSYVTVVEAEGFPAQTFGPFEVRGAASIGHDLALARGGAIEGHVLLLPGESPAGRLVGASSGWGTVFTAPLDEERAYRLEDLAPGGYQVRICRPPAASVHVFGPWTLQQGSAGAFEADCIVREGTTTRFDLDLSAEGSVLLNGTFQVPALEGCWAALKLAGEARASARTQGDAEGRFRLAVSRPGRYSLEIQGTTSKGAFSIFRQSISLAPGEQEWRFSHACGRVEATVEPGMRQLLGRDFLALVWQGEDGSSYETRVALGCLSDGEAIALPFPAGKFEVRRAGESLGEALCEPIVLGAGERVVLDLSR